MDDDALMAKLMAAFDDDAAPDQPGTSPDLPSSLLTRNGSSPGSTRSSTRTPPPRQGRTWSRP